MEAAPAEIDSFYTLEELYGARRYKSPLYWEPFFKGDRKGYLDALQYRYLSLLDYSFFPQDSESPHREIFLQELEDLIDELKELKISREYLRGILETKGVAADPLYERILLMIEGTSFQEERKHFRADFLIKLVGGTGILVLALYLHFRFVLQP